MIRHHQTQLDDPENGTMGNCFSTCIACLLDMHPGRVPNFCGLAEDWRRVTNLWLTPRNLFYLDVKLPGDMRDELVSNWGYHIMSGDGPRGVRHSVIGYAGDFVWDVYPQGSFLLPNNDDNYEYGLLVPVDLSAKIVMGD